MLVKNRSGVGLFCLVDGSYAPGNFGQEDIENDEIISGEV